MASFDLKDPVFGAYAFYATAVTMKMLLMSFMTIRHRLQKQVFSNKEDYMGVPADKRKPNLADQDVERVRRCHLNDLENIPAFLVIAFLYVISGPDAVTALWHFRIFFGARVLHTFCYMMGLQPFRGLAFGVGWMATASMAYRVLSLTWT